MAKAKRTSKAHTDKASAAPFADLLLTDEQLAARDHTRMAHRADSPDTARLLKRRRPRHGVHDDNDGT